MKTIEEQIAAIIADHTIPAYAAFLKVQALRAEQRRREFAAG